MTDVTEGIRRDLQQELSAEAAERAGLEAKHGQVWSTQEVQKEFEITGFMAPFVVVTRKADGVVGSLMFQHSPRYYFSFTPDR
jgi:hypothetical protein